MRQGLVCCVRTRRTHKAGSACNVFSLSTAVMAAVSFLGESFSAINGVGLVVLIGGVALFNWTKYQKMLSGQAKGARRSPLSPMHLQSHSCGISQMLCQPLSVMHGGSPGS